MIRTLGDEDKVKWTTHLNTLCSAYNSTVHSSTGFSPYWLLMGRKPRLAVDLNMGTNLSEHGPSSSYKYVQDLEKRLQWSHKLAQKHMEKQAAKAKKYYDRRVRCSKLEPGDLVLVKRFGFKGKHKIQDRWEHHVYEVLESCHSSPLVFRVRREDGEGRVRVLHRNLLLPFKTRILDGRQHPSQLLKKSLKIATRLEPQRSLLRRTKKILLMMYKVLVVFHKVVMNLVCLQGLGQEAKVHLQFWLAPNLFPNVVSTQLLPCCQSRGRCNSNTKRVCW